MFTQETNLWCGAKMQFKITIKWKKHVEYIEYVFGVMLMQWNGLAVVQVVILKDLLKAFSLKTDYM